MKAQTNRLLLLVITELCLKLFSGGSRLLVNSLWIDQKGVGVGAIAFRLVKKKKGKTSKQNVLT